jgi:hypothetical protein
MIDTKITVIHTNFLATGCHFKLEKSLSEQHECYSRSHQQLIKCWKNCIPIYTKQAIEIAEGTLKYNNHTKGSSLVYLPIIKKIKKSSCC